MRRDIRDTLAAAVSGKYALEEEVGRGGMGVVFRATDLRTKQDVALKVMRPEFIATVRADQFLREVEIHSRLEHPGILPTLDSGTTVDGLLYLATPFMPEGTLTEYLRERHSLPIARAIEIGCDVAAALDYAHSQKVRHGDINPANILLSRNRALLSDFGLAVAGANASSIRFDSGTGYFEGTIAYMSPEQFGGDPGKIDGRSDIYSLGCVLYHMLVGEPPFAGPPRVVLARHLSERVQNMRIVRQEIPPGLQEAVERALAKNPSDRHQTANELGEDLRFQLRRLQQKRVATRRDTPSKKVFIGHGRSEQWKALRDFLQDRLGLEWDEFNREPMPGISTANRLQAMLDEAGFAFLVLTAEDAYSDGSTHARENVIHEIGLFQGRLGFRRAIILLEEGCHEFSNIHGLTEIRFPVGELMRVTEEVRSVLEREDYLDGDATPGHRWRFWRR